MLEGEADVDAGQLGQAALEAWSALFGGAAPDFAEPMEAAQGQGIQQRLFIGEVAAGRGVADAEFPAEFAQGDAGGAVAFQGFLGCFQ